MYANIVLLDQKYQQLLKSLPPFFQLTNRINSSVYSALVKEKPYIEPQRYLIIFMAAVVLAMARCFNPNKIPVEQRKKDVLRDCRVLEEELSAKMEPMDELGNEGDSNGYLMLKAFQKALLNLRGLFRSTNGKEKLQQVESVSGVCEWSSRAGRWSDRWPINQWDAYDTRETDR